MAKPSDRIFLLLVLILALVLRLDFLIANHFVIDSDEAIVGLMARHILDGQGVPVFYYGQHYMGSFEPIVVSLVFAIFGASSVALKCVPLFFSLILVLLVYWLARLTCGRVAGRYAAILCALPPHALVIWSAMARGGFIEILVIGALALLLTCVWLKREPPAPSALFWPALVLGFGWWVNNQIIYFMLPIGLFVIAHLLHEPIASSARDRVKCILLAGLVGFVGFVFGGAPFWIYNLSHNFVSFEMLKSSGSGAILDHLLGTIETALPILFGAKRFWQTGDLFPLADWIAWLAAILILIGVVRWRGAQLRKLVRFEIDAQTPVELFLLLLLACVAVFVCSSFGWLVTAPRYLLPMYVGIFVLLGCWLGHVAEKRRLIAALICAALVVWNLNSSYFGRRALPGEPYVFETERVAKDHTELLTWLESHDIKWIKTNYWIGYRLAFESAERVRFLVFQEPLQTRIPEWRAAARAQPEQLLPYVLVPGQADIVRQGLAALGCSFEEQHLSGYVVLARPCANVHFGALVDRRLLAADANFHSEAAAFAVDGDVKTRWGSAHPQEPSMEFSLSLSRPQRLAGLEYQFGDFAHDYPRGLEIVAQDENGNETQLLTNEQWSAVRYLISNSPSFTLSFKPLRVRKLILREVGSHPVLDWSIAELNLFVADPS